MAETKKTVLIIDDDENILVLLRAFIEENGCRGLTAATAEKGLVQLRSATIDLVLLDIALEEADGLDVLKTIIKISPDIPVIMITGYSDVEKAKASLENGASDYITKPFDPEYLRTSVFASILGR